MSDIGFALNYTYLHRIDIPGYGWAYLGAGIQTIDGNPNEQTDNTAYYDGMGLSSTQVTGGQLVMSFSGHRRMDDAAQNYIAGLRFEYGSARNVKYQFIAPNGDIVEGDATISNIKPEGGDANSKASFGFELSFNGLPNFTPGHAEGFPISVTASPVSVSVGATSKITTSVSPSTASPAVVYNVEDDAVATVNGDGLVHGITAGKTKVSIKSVVKPSISTVVEVTVTA